MKRVLQGGGVWKWAVSNFSKLVQVQQVPVKFNQFNPLKDNTKCKNYESQFLFQNGVLELNTLTERKLGTVEATPV